MLKKLVIAAVTALLIVALCSGFLGLLFWGVDTFVFQVALWLKLSKGTAGAAVWVCAAVLAVIIFAILKHED